MDYDGPLYAAAATSAKLSTAIGKAQKALYEFMFLTNCRAARAHLTSRLSTKAGRFELIGAKGAYQGNRDSTPKPPLLEPLREAMAKPGVFPDPNVQVFLHTDKEADDGMMIDAYSVKDAVVASADKDLRIVPCAYYDMTTGKIDRIKDRFGWASYNPTLEKVVGHGTKFFWAQMLMGDVADHVRGLLHVQRHIPDKVYKRPPKDPSKRKLGYTVKDECGVVLTGQILDRYTSEDACANGVIDLYRDIDQNPLPEAAMLWLLRTPEDSGEGYIWSLNLTPANREFIEDCWNRPYRKEQDETQDSPDDLPPWD